MNGKVGEVEVRMFAEGRKSVLNSTLFADDTVLIAENKSDLQKSTGEREWVGEVWNALRENAWTGRPGDNSAVATPLGEIPVRG